MSFLEGPEAAISAVTPSSAAKLTSAPFTSSSRNFKASPLDAARIRTGPSMDGLAGGGAGGGWGNAGRGRRTRKRIHVVKSVPSMEIKCDVWGFQGGEEVWEFWECWLGWLMTVVRTIYSREQL